MFKTIIMAYDGSAASERVLLYAEHMARREDVEIIVVHAYEVPEIYEWTDSFADLEAQLERTAAEVTDDAVSALQRAGVKAMGDVRRGPAVQCILDAVGFHQADLIVMGGRTQKRDSVAEALLGSVSTAVLRYANCPVLVVP
ncbi:MAG: universal stress protein [Caldilineaceae bacterium]|nr:universal stress protein [Caldilineaceae bacterium]